MPPLCSMNWKNLVNRGSSVSGERAPNHTGSPGPTATWVIPDQRLL